MVPELVITEAPSGFILFAPDNSHIAVGYSHLRYMKMGIEKKCQL